MQVLAVKPRRLSAKNKTLTHVYQLDEDGRKQEIVRLLGGSDNDEFAVKHAEELLNQAREYKKFPIR